MVLDLYSRKVVGWAIDRRCETALVNDALAKAGTSRPTSPSTVVHSDHGSQFTAWGFTENVRRLGLVSSMGTVGDCYDNAPMESFFFIVAGMVEVLIGKGDKARAVGS